MTEYDDVSRTTTKRRKPVSLKPVTLPVFSSNDPVARAQVLSLGGQRNLNISLRGEKVIERVVEKVVETVEEKVVERVVKEEVSLEEISHRVGVEELIEILKIKMYRENIEDMQVYDLLFEDRLKRKNPLSRFTALFRGKIGNDKGAS